MQALEGEIAKIEHTPTSEAGVDYIKAVLNPCGEDPLPSLSGIPDGGEVGSALLRLRDDLVYGPPVLLPSELWSTIVFSTPYLLDQLIIIRFGGITPPTRENVRRGINAIPHVNWDTTFRYPNFGLVTAILLDNGGTAQLPQAAQFELTHMVPTALRDFSSEAGTNAWSRFRKYRTVYKGHTLHLNAPGLANQGRIITAEIGTESSVKNVDVVRGPTEDPVNAFVASRFTVTPPFDDQTLAMSDNGACQDIVKKGSYVMQRHWGEVVNWVDCEDVRPIFRVANGSLTGDTFNMGIDLMKVDGFDPSMGWIVQHVRGIDAAATIHIKHRVGISMNVDGQSPYSPFMSAATPKDAPALAFEKELGCKLPHTYESIFNDWGFLSGIIKNCINNIGRPVIRNALQFGAKTIHRALDVGHRAATRAVSGYEAEGGPTEYGDRSVY